MKGLFYVISFPVNHISNTMACISFPQPPRANWLYVTSWKHLNHQRAPHRWHRLVHCPLPVGHTTWKSDRQPASTGCSPCPSLVTRLGLNFDVTNKWAVNQLWLITNAIRALAAVSSSGGAPFPLHNSQLNSLRFDKPTPTDDLGTWICTRWVGDLLLQVGELFFSLSVSPIVTISGHTVVGDSWWMPLAVWMGDLVLLKKKPGKDY